MMVKMLKPSQWTHSLLTVSVSKSCFARLGSIDSSEAIHEHILMATNVEMLTNTIFI